ncbi:MAG TPA: hypothetical protein VLL76_06125 [Candidatus Omnitrophota bacterium]|nr:hypothetical protein [Candidatus Omnitrophota bacterium]
MSKRLLSLLTIILLALHDPAAAREQALDLLDAPVPYTAQFRVASDRGVYHGTVWHAPGRERREFDTQGGGQALLLRRDTDSAYLMKPGGRWYVGLALSAAAGLAGGLDGMIVKRTRVKDDTVAGIRATQYRVDATAAKGGRFDGDAWFTKDGIMVKAVGTVHTPGGKRMPVETSLSGLKLGAVDERKFELPAGWLGMDLRSVPAERLEQAVESLRPMLER